MSSEAKILLYIELFAIWKCQLEQVKVFLVQTMYTRYLTKYRYMYYIYQISTAAPLSFIPVYKQTAYVRTEND